MNDEQIKVMGSYTDTSTTEGGGNDMDILSGNAGLTQIQMLG